STTFINIWIIIPSMKYHWQDSKTVIITPEHDEDIWVLYGVIQIGDIVRTKTIRKIKIGDTQEKTKVITKQIVLSITVEKKEFLGDTLRLLGSIYEGTQDIPKGEHHSFAITPSDTLHITKVQWPHYMKDALQEAKKTKQQLLVCVFDREEAIL